MEAKSHEGGDIGEEKGRADDKGGEEKGRGDKEAEQWAKDDEWHESAPSDGSIVAKLMEYYYADDSLQETLTKWAYDHCDAFEEDRGAGADEYKLEFTPLHAEFCSLFESLLEDFLKGQGFTVQKFYEQLQSEAAEKYGEADTFVQVIAAAVDFEMFIKMMRFAKEDEL